MILVDSSIWIDVFRDRSGERVAVLRRALGEQEVALSRFHQMEMLQGCRDEREWQTLQEYLDVQTYLELRPSSWRDAARIYFDLRRAGRTVRSPIDCCIAQLALDEDVLLLHRDRDFAQIAAVRPLRQLWLDW